MKAASPLLIFFWRVMQATAFFVLQLIEVSGWLWTFPQAEQRNVE